MELKNDTSSVAYVGLQLMKGKVIVIDNNIAETRSLVIKEKYVIAHTSSLELHPFDRHNVLPENRRREPNVGPRDLGWLDRPLDDVYVGQKMVQASAKRDTYRQDAKLVSKQLTDVVKDASQLSEVYNKHVLPTQEVIFLQSQSNFIEKTLGEGERMRLRFECLVAHSTSVRV